MFISVRARYCTSNEKMNKPLALLPTNFRQYKKITYSTERHTVSGTTETKSLLIKQSKATISVNLLKMQFNVAKKIMDSKSRLYGSKYWLLKNGVIIEPVS